MALQYSTTHRNNAMADITTQVSTTGYILLYTAAAANCAAAASGSLLASLPVSNPFAPAPSGGVLTATTPMTATATGTGTAVQWRLCTSSAGTTVVAQGTVGTSGADLNLTSTSISTGQTVTISSFAITAFGA